MRKTSIIFVAITLACALPACRRTPAAPPPPQAVKVATVERTANAIGNRYSAHIEPASRVDVAFKVGGYVESITTALGVGGKRRVLQEGDEVKRGQELAALRRADYEQQLAVAKAAQAEAAAAHAQAELEVARSDKLSSTGSITSAQVDADRTRLASAAASLEGAKARVAEAQLALSDSSLRSPLHGTILRRTIEVGTLVSPGMAAFTVADLSSVKVIFAVPETALSDVKLGTVQTVTTEAMPGKEFHGRITRISPSADPRSRVFEAEVLIDNTEGLLKPGTVAALSLKGDAGSAKAQPLVPLAAVVRGRGSAHNFAVFVIDDQQGRPLARSREVVLGEYLGRVIAVQSGLRDGERIVVQGAGLLSDGEPVEIVE